VGGDVIDLSFPGSGNPGVLGVLPVHELSDGVLGEPKAAGEVFERAEEQQQVPSAAASGGIDRNLTIHLTIPDDCEVRM
jgi:hypothetical protein